MSSSKPAHPSRLLVILAFAVVYIVWGSTYFFIQKAVHHIPPFIMGALRFLTAGLLLLGWCILKKEKVFVIRHMKTAAVSGLLLLFVGNGVVIWVEQYMPSAMVAIMVSSAPLWFVLLDKPMWRDNFSTPGTVTGLITGFAGVILLFWDQVAGNLLTGDHHRLEGLILLVIASVAWSGGSLYSKYYSKQGSPASVNTAWQMIAAGLAFIPCSFIRNEMGGFDWQAVPAGAWLSLIYLILMGSIAAFSAYVWLLRVRPATQVSTYAYVNPVIAVLLGVFFAGESITLFQVLGLVVILVSVLLINLAKYRRRGTGPAPSR